MALMSGMEYIESLRELKPILYISGERVENFVDHPLVRPGINIVARMHDLALDPRYQELMTATSHLTGERVHRFNHVYRSVDDLVKNVEMLRLTNQAVGTCAIWCVTKELINPLSDTTHRIDKKHGTDYHSRFNEYLQHLQERDLFAAAAITDVKGDRSKRPSQQPDPDMYLHLVAKRDDGIIIRGAKMHQTGALASHFINCTPSAAMGEADKDYALACAVPTDAPGLIHVLGHHALDERRLEGFDLGNPRYDMHEALLIFNDVFVPWERVFMCGEYELTAALLENFIAMHRTSYGGCRPGTFDVLIGAAKLMADYNGVSRASHVRDKLTEMSFLNETMWGCGLAAAVQGQKLPSGGYAPNFLLANVTKLHVTRIPHEIAKLAQDLTGGILGTMPSERDLMSPEVGPLVRKYLKGVEGVPTEDRMKVVRLVEFMTQGVTLPADYFGGGGPQTQRIAIEYATDFRRKAELAKMVAGVSDAPPEGELNLAHGCCAAFGSEICPMSQRG